MMTRKFTKDTTNIVKGILIIFMLIHHLFSGDIIENMGLIPICDDVVTRTHFVDSLRIILGGFAFLSAYGMAQGYKKRDFSSMECLKRTGARLIGLFSTMFPIFVLSLCYMKFVRGEHIKLLYVGADGKFSFVYFLVDMLGLSTYFGRTGFNVTWWYLSYAILLIIAMPLLVAIYRKVRHIIILPSIFLPIVLFKNDAHFSVLLPTAMLGIAFAWEDWFEKIDAYLHEGKTILKEIVAALISVALLIFTWFAIIDLDMTFFFPMATVLCFVSFEYLENTKIISKILGFLGKNCTNIFLTHTLIYYYWYSDFIYSFKYTVVITIVLLAISLVISITLELLKKITGYNKLVIWCQKKVLGEL